MLVWFKELFYYLPTSMQGINYLVFNSVIFPPGIQINNEIYIVRLFTQLKKVKAEVLSWMLRYMKWRQFSH